MHIFNIFSVNTNLWLDALNFVVPISASPFQDP